MFYSLGPKDALAASQVKRPKAPMACPESDSHDSQPWEISLLCVCCHLRLNPVMSQPQKPEATPISLTGEAA